MFFNVNVILNVENMFINERLLQRSLISPLPQLHQLYSAYNTTGQRCKQPAAVGGVYGDSLDFVGQSLKQLLIFEKKKKKNLGTQ